MVLCAVYGCTHEKKHCSKYFKFPRVKESNFEHFELILNRRIAWFHALRRSDITERDLDTKVICKCHFISGRPARLLETNDLDWIPTRKIPESEKSSNIAKSPRKKKLVKKFSRIPGKPHVWSVDFSNNNNNEISETVTLNNAIMQTENTNSIPTKSVTLVDAQTQTDITGVYIDQIRIKTAQLLHLRDNVVSVQLTKINPQQVCKSA